VDCHKSTHTVVFLNTIGEMLGYLTFPTTHEGYEAALEMGKSLGCSSWGIEGSGLYGFAFAVTIEAEGATVHEVPGLYTKRHRRQSSHRGKCDLNDARAIAEVVLREEGRLSRFYLATLQRGLRMRYDQRDRFVRERTSAANRLRSAALLLSVSKLPKDITSTRAARRLRLAATKFRSATEADVAMSAVLDELEDAAESIERINVSIRRIERIIRSMVRDIAPELLDLHGVSDVAAAGLIGHSGDIRNCRNAASFAMRCGAAPIQCSSGRTEAVRVNLGGNRQLNRLLHIASIAQIRSATHPGRKYYERKRAEGKTHLAALRCLKRTLATVVFYRLRQVAERLEQDELASQIAA
jgi:transposase